MRKKFETQLQYNKIHVTLNVWHFRDMKIHTRHFHLWLSMFGVWWMVLQRAIFVMPWRNLVKSGKTGALLLLLQAQTQTTVSVIAHVEFHLRVAFFFSPCIKLRGVDAQEASSFGGVCRHEWIVHSCNLCCWQPSVHCWSPSIYQLLNKPEDIQARRLWRLQEC